MRLLVHAGTEKTGSSYLQTAFWAADEALVSEGIHYSADRFDSSDRFGGVQGDGVAVEGLIHGRDEVGLIYLLRGWREVGRRSWKMATLQPVHRTQNGDL